MGRLLEGFFFFFLHFYFRIGLSAEFCCGSVVMTISKIVMLGGSGMDDHKM